MLACYRGFSKDELGRNGDAIGYGSIIFLELDGLWGRLWRAQNMDLKLPHLGEGADSGTVVNLFVKEGDTVAKDQPILELENEKAVATIPSTGAGTVSKVFVKAGDWAGGACVTISMLTLAFLGVGNIIDRRRRRVSRRQRNPRR